MATESEFCFAFFVQTFPCAQPIAESRGQKPADIPFANQTGLAWGRLETEPGHTERAQVGEISATNG
jgi:hypothetical protein